MSPKDANRGRLWTLAGAASLFALNAWVVSRFARTGFIDQMGSSEGPVLALIRHIMRHPGDLLWFPMWQDGMPFPQVYQPALHWTTAQFARAASVPPERAYHLVAALLYALGPVTLYWLCYRLTFSRVHGFLTGLLYSLFSPSGLLAATTRDDMGGLFHARRYQVLVHYGEGPHLMALTLIPLAIWGLDRALNRDRRIFAPVSAVLLGAVVATNWTGTVGLVVAVAAYFAAQLGKLPLSRWCFALGIAGLAYLLICRWVPPSAVALVPANAQNSVGTFFGGAHALWLGVLIVLVAGSHFLLERLAAPRSLRFFLYFFLVSAFIVLPSSWADVSIIPQPRRLHLEMEMAFAALAMYPVSRLWERSNHRVQIGMAVLLVLLCAVQFRNYRAYARAITRPVEIAKTIEYREAQWFDRNLPGVRVFAPGSVDMWMNVFTDSPQMVGCCDQGVPSIEQRIAFYTVYVRDQAGDEEGELAALWLKAYGAAAVGVSGPRSSESYKPYQNPRKFEGVLPVLWRDGDDVIYQVTAGPHSLAHVVRADEVVRRPPTNGLDVAPLRPFVVALEDRGRPAAQFQWLSQHEARIAAPIQSGELLSVQISYARGWRAEANGQPAPVGSDGLGLIIVEPPCRGPCRIDLTYDGGAELRWTRVAQWIGFALCVLWAVFGPDSRRSAPR